MCVYVCVFVPVAVSKVWGQKELQYTGVSAVGMTHWLEIEQNDKVREVRTHD